MKYIGKSLKEAKKISTLMAQRVVYALDANKRYFGPARPFLPEGNMTFYGRVDQTGAAIEPIYDYSLTSLIGTNEVFYALEFVAEQYASMKLKYELNSRKTGALGTLEPKRAVVRGDFLYEEHLDSYIDGFIEDLFSTSSEKVVNFHMFCSEFIRFVKRTRIHKDIGGLPVSKALFYVSALAPINVSGLVIDFETSGFGDDAKKQEEWLSDDNFKLFCNAADYAGFYVDFKHPWRIIANLAAKRMQRAAEWTAGSAYLPGTASNIFSKYYFNISLYDFLIFKNKLFTAWDEIVKNRPVAKQPVYCKSGSLKVREVQREQLGLEDLLIPPMPGQERQNVYEFFRVEAGEFHEETFDLEDRLVRYGLHSGKYDMIYWLKFYIEVRYNEIYEIKNYLTVKEKNAIVQTAVKTLRTGDIEAAFEYVGRQFQSYRFLDH